VWIRALPIEEKIVKVMATGDINSNELGRALVKKISVGEAMKLPESGRLGRNPLATD
jgi:hypothetical protein